MPYILPMSCDTEAHETIQWALLKEKHYTAVRNPLYLSQVQHHGMTATWRLRVCRWMFETAREFDLQMDTVFTALHFLDQYLSVHSVDRGTLQLLSMICMWTASKMREGRPILLEEMALMCERKFTRAQMVDAEAQLVRLVKFRFNPPNIFTMARDFVNELPFEEDKDRRANCVASVFNVLERVAEDMSLLDCSVSSLAKAAVQLVAKSEYNLSVAQLLKALKLVKVEEDAYRTAFKIVRGAYFGTPIVSTKTQTPPRIVTTSEVLEPIKSLTQSPTAIEQVPQFLDEGAASSFAAVTGLDDADLICTETLSPSPAQVSPAPARSTSSPSSTIGVPRTASSPARSVSDAERPNKRQRKLSM
uniref:Cyclin-like domain-containing protein n=1 Tax=Peronospora matthiolae TaxID=2874970 RepID=A0AAV1T175_9STRA